MQQPSNVTRRNFLKAGALATAALSTGAPFIRAQDKSGLKLPILGTGAHTGVFG